VTAVAAFENRTGEPSLYPVGRMAAEWTTEGISGIRINGVPSADVFDAPVAVQTEGKLALPTEKRGAAQRRDLVAAPRLAPAPSPLTAAG
jgi:hypothetical protein